MDSPQDVLEFVWGVGQISVRIVGDYFRSPYASALEVGIAIGLTIVSFLVCAFTARIWNRRFHLGVGHYILSSIAAAIVLVTALAYPAMEHYEHFANLWIDSWVTSVDGDRWIVDQSGERGERELNKYRDIGAERLTPRGLLVEADEYPEEARVYAKVQYSILVESFQQREPFVSRLVTAQDAPGIRDDFASWITYQLSVRNSVPFTESAAWIANHLRVDFSGQTGRVARWASVILLMLGFLSFGCALATISVAAYKDIKVRPQG